MHFESDGRAGVGSSSPELGADDRQEGFGLRVSGLGFRSFCCLTIDIDQACAVHTGRPRLSPLGSKSCACICFRCQSLVDLASFMYAALLICQYLLWKPWM